MRVVGWTNFVKKSHKDWKFFRIEADVFEIISQVYVKLN